MNPAGLAMVEADSLEQVRGRSVYRHISPDHREAFVALTEKVLRGGSGTLEFELVGLKGTRRWLDTHANDDTLLRTLGVLSMRAADPRDAREYLVRALVLQPSAAGWAALGDVQSAAGEPEDAVRCYANAWKCEQGEAIAPGPHEAGIDTAHVTLEERDEHGMPRLPGEQSSPAR